MRTLLSRRRLLGAALLTWCAWPTVAAADAEWCFDDPPVHVRLPSGSPVTVNLHIAVPAGRRNQLKAATATTTVAVVGDGQTAITVQLLVPPAVDGAFPVQVSAAAGRYQAATTGAGTAGVPVLLTLVVPAT